MREVEVVAWPRAMQRRADELRRAGRRIAFVPTMGCLHQGHLSLMREGRRRGDVLVVSIFVNPTQFGPGEDWGRYPRAFERDCAMMRSVPVEVVFAPQPSAMYPPGAQTWVDVAELTKGLCGAHRPGHFRGVATVVAKLFNIVKPHVALFGEKDFQQLRAIERMVRDLDFDVEIVALPTVREPDGLAMSSRNAYLSPQERERALSLSRALEAARRAFERGARETRAVLGAAQSVLAAAAEVKVEYLAAVDAETLQPMEKIERPVVVAVAARVGATRLIDNLVLAPAPSAEPDRRR